MEWEKQHTTSQRTLCCRRPKQGGIMSEPILDGNGVSFFRGFITALLLSAVIWILLICISGLALADCDYTPPGVKSGERISRFRPWLTWLDLTLPCPG
jgi:hypothetical protein